MTDKHVTIIGGGVAGLSAALDLAHFGVRVDVVERSGFLGGHAIRYTCKATDQCVRCGACMVEEKLKAVLAQSTIRFYKHRRCIRHRKNGRFLVELQQDPLCIDPQKCNNCGICFEKCPEQAINRGSSAHHHPFYFLDTHTCSRAGNADCNICSKSCPQGAIRLDAAPHIETGTTDAVLLTTGFSPFAPEDKPYGFGLFQNVVTNLELEAIFRQCGSALRPSDQSAAERIAFIQCVGSRDAKLNHLWCSRVCCASALRMAGRIKFDRPETEISCFYIDIQTFGKDFETFFTRIKHDIRFVRSIPGDVFELEDKRLKLIYTDPVTHESCEEQFDLVVLSIGLCPNMDAVEETGPLELKPDSDGFFSKGSPKDTGVFVAGTATGPMSIPESIASAGSAAKEILSYLELLQLQQSNRP
ncbi:MAG: FAD-dependent oxidoreductase [Deltaproteobacteria bacterium]